MDIPYTDYNSGKEDKGKKPSNDLADRLNEESVRKMRERIARKNAEQSEKINLSEFLNQE